MKRFLLISPVFLMLAACSHSTNTTLNGAEGGIPWKVPGKGTSYLNEQFENGIIIKEPEDSVIVIQTGQQFGGKTNIFTLQHANTPSDTFFYAIDSNGNFSCGFEAGDSIGWITYPTGTHNKIAGMAALDSIEDGIEIVSSDTLSFVGSENTTVPAGTFSTLHVHETFVNDEFITGLSPVLDTTVSDYWFAPSIAYPVKETALDVGEDDIMQDTAYNTDDELLRYLPK